MSSSSSQVNAAKAAAIAAANKISAQILEQQTIPSPSPSPSPSVNPAFQAIEKEIEQKRLEEEMRRRRERIEKWRNEKKSKEEVKHEVVVNEKKGKSWNLEDDDDDDEELKLSNKKIAESVEKAAAALNAAVLNIESTKAVKRRLPADTNSKDDEDTLDAFMRDIHRKKSQQTTENVKRVKTKVETVIAVKKPEGYTESKSDVKKVTIITGKAKSTIVKDKGDIMEDDGDEAELTPDEDSSPENENMPKQKTKSEMVFTDHSKVYYRPFRKNFYVEVPELGNMKPEEVDAYREELEGIKVKGKNCPKPIKTWAQCGVSFKVLECLKKNNFDRPTPIQAQAIPIIMSGRDMIGIAKTGSGKTLAFLIPMFRHILDQPPLEVDDGPIAVIMTPTRELATQITKECKKFSKYLNLNVVAVYGGTNISEQIAELKRGTEIIVCTPGRMIDMLAANNGRVTNLRRITYVVLDEADRMFDMGFEPQVTKILDNIRPDKQIVMYSATFPRKMEDLARKALNKPIEVTVGGRSVVCKDVEQHVLVIDEDTKYLKLLELLGIFYLRNIICYKIVCFEGYHLN